MIQTLHSTQPVDTSTMDLRSVWILAVLNMAIVSCLLTNDLTCPGNGVEIEIDINGYEPRGFRFPDPKTGTSGFPTSTTCRWKFKTQADLRIVLGVTDIVKDKTDVITVRDTTDSVLPTTIIDVGMKEGLEIVTSTGKSISISLETDGSSNNEEIYIYVIAGIDSGTCPGTSTISATDEYKIITSSNFPDKYNDDEVCEVTITADENKTLTYEILFKQIQDSTTFDECSEILEVFDGSTLGNKIFDTCNSFLPGRLSKLKSTNVGRTLDLRFNSNTFKEKSGFVLLFKQEDVNECLESACKQDDPCFVPESLNEYECDGNGATYVEKRYLSCPKDGSEVVIDVPEFEPQSFLFPPPESDGLAISSTCTWIFKGKAGSGILTKVYDITFEGTDNLRIEDDKGDEINTFTGPLINSFERENGLSLGNSVKVTLTTDNQSSNLEKFKLSIISGRDSGTCPGFKIIQATENFQTITSGNFPHAFEINADCDITIKADEGKVIVFSIPVVVIDDYRDICEDSLSLFAENESLFTCVPFQPALNGQTTGNSLRIRFTSDTDNSDREYGFAIKFKQKAIQECIRNISTESGLCDSNAVCVNTNESFECECIDGFVGSGFECKESIRKKILLPLYLAWSLGTTVGGATLLVLLYKMADSWRPGM